MKLALSCQIAEAGPVTAGVGGLSERTDSRRVRGDRGGPTPPTSAVQRIGNYS